MVSSSPRHTHTHTHTLAGRHEQTKSNQTKRNQIKSHRGMNWNHGHEARAARLVAGGSCGGPVSFPKPVSVPQNGNGRAGDGSDDGTSRRRRPPLSFLVASLRTGEYYTLAGRWLFVRPREREIHFHHSHHCHCCSHGSIQEHSPKENRRV